MRTRSSAVVDEGDKICVIKRSGGLLERFYKKSKYHKTHITWLEEDD